MSERRSKLEIMLKVLEAVREGVDKPTRIMYAANMSWNPTQEVLARLVEDGLIRVTEESGGRRSKKRYEITEKGANVIRYFQGVKALINI
ncbi:MAG: helix-turn-helix transcriptional regulator [Candidatus Bathyarchaeota archaeon]|nr:helix-turn-helix transcriptional regulator [Candidatus Bathyarchaeota archaeon]